MLTRKIIEQREREMLAPYASLSEESRGRVFPTKVHPLRTDFQRDRDRIVHSASFRRMEYKTQVFIPHEKDHFRTRLTHTIEVAQISRTLARILRLNEDLAEAIALVHDVGHTPFGHSGEDVLNDLLKDYGGFNHNRQSLRIVDLLEQRYDEHPGLNLSYEIREGIVKHETKNKMVPEEFSPEEQPTLEAALVDIADEITYNAHDIDDGLSSGIITPADLQQLKFWKYLQLESLVSSLDSNDDKKRYKLIRSLLDFMVTDVVNETKLRLVHFDIQSLDEVRETDEKICAYSDANALIVFDIKKFLSQNLYNHPKLITMSEWAEEIIQYLFKYFTDRSDKLPERFQEMLLTEEKEIVIADYIAGMTDRYAINLYDRLQSVEKGIV